MPADTITADVVIAGGGNAALCAALEASEAGATVTILEAAPRDFRGGNSRHTRNMRVMSDAYPEGEYFADVLRVTEGNTDEHLARLVIRESQPATAWMKQHGVKFQPALEGTLGLDRTNAFFLGGGKALLNAYYAAAEKRGVNILYNAEVTNLNITRVPMNRDRKGADHFEAGIVLHEGVKKPFRARAFIAASGGFESNLEWLEQAWGPAAQNFLIRGTPYNKGGVLRLLLDRGATPVGDPTQCHAVAIDGRAPKFDGGIVTRLDCVPLGIVVNRNAERFYDEGEDMWPKRYAIWGRLVAQQPDQVAYSIIDAKVANCFMPSVFPPIESQTIGGIAEALGLDAAQLSSTIENFNSHVLPGQFDHHTLDTCRAANGLTPPKSHWAQKIDTPPFWAYPLRPGITFTYLGVKVSDRAQVRFNGLASPNLFAAGEIMAGNILGKGYPAGFGMTIGTVFGRIAGREAARAARS